MASTAVGRPPRRKTARKLRDAKLPSVTSTWSSGSVCPANWIRTPNWSDQKYGAAVYAAVLPGPSSSRGRDGGLFQSGGPVLGTVMTAQPGMEGTGTVPDGHDSGQGGAAPRVAHHAVVQRETAPRQPVHRGTGTDRDQDHVRGQLPSVGQPHPGHPVTARDTGHRRARDQADPVLGVERGTHLVPDPAEDPGERRGPALHDGDIEAEGRRTGRGLGTDQPGAHDHQPCPRPQFGPQCLGVGEGAQHMNAREPRRAGQWYGGGTGGHDDAVAHHPGAVVQVHGTPGRVQQDRAPAEPPVQVKGGVGVRRQGEVGRLRPAQEEVLRQRRPVVRRDVLRADDHQPPVVAPGP